MEYFINRGIGNTPEFKGLKRQYLYLFVGGILGSFLLFVFLYMVGVDPLICIVIGSISVLSSTVTAFCLNKQFGENGLLQWEASLYRPKYIINCKKIHELLKTKTK